jgi:hypothetical protein
MKVSSDPGMASALDTWLRAAEASTPTQPSGVADLIASTPPAATVPARDGAEALLDLDVWGGSAAPLRGFGSPPSTVQSWADYIFQPLRQERADESS